MENIGGRYALSKRYYLLLCTWYLDRFCWLGDSDDSPLCRVGMSIHWAVLPMRTTFHSERESMHFIRNSTSLCSRSSQGPVVSRLLFFAGYPLVNVYKQYGYSTGRYPDEFALRRLYIGPARDSLPTSYSCTRCSISASIDRGRIVELSTAHTQQSRTA